MKLGTKKNEITPPGEKLRTIGYFKKKVLGVKGMKMDSGVSYLTIVHVRVYINPKIMYSKQFKGISRSPEGVLTYP